MDVPLKDACSLWAPEISVLPSRTERRGQRREVQDEQSADESSADASDASSEADVDRWSASDGLLVVFTATQAQGLCPSKMRERHTRRVAARMPPALTTMP